MLNHVEIHFSAPLRSAAFHDAVLAPLGAGRRTDHEHRIGYGPVHPEFWIGPVAGPGGPAREADLAFTAPGRAGGRLRDPRLMRPASEWERHVRGAT
ncbi:hypothetical protein ACOZFM_19575 [Streptomyces arboris]|uniref:hypothetical protein n=1 Tax=Streptomyces arboris TaxID=2600619 RepID=UPI003BF5BF43